MIMTLMLASRGLRDWIKDEQDFKLDSKSGIKMTRTVTRLRNIYVAL